MGRMTESEILPCAVGFARTGLAAWGSAPRARFWVCLETAGPWGHDAITQSRHLDPAIGKAIDDLAKQRGGKLVLIRRSHRVYRDSRPQRVRVAGGFDGGGWYHGFTVSGPAELLEWLQQWDGAPLPTTHPATVLVCTNAKRDQCCALQTRPVISQLDDIRDHLWESSHLGGHRFAPTALLLPTGQALATLDASQIRTALDAASRGLLWPGGETHDRGRTVLEPMEQAAHAWALQEFGASTPDRVTSTVEADGTVTVTHGASRRRLLVEKHTTDVVAPLGCGKEPEPLTQWRVEELA